MDKVLADLRSFIAFSVQEGFDSIHEMMENAQHYALERHGRDDLQLEIKRIVAELLTAHQTDQSHWESPTDCDRLDEAFAALNRQGIVARQNYSCCNNCGFTEIWEEVQQEEAHQPVEGYVFYHLQCTQRAIKSGQLLLAYGCVDEDEASLIRVANKIVAELRRVGFDADWKGTADYPIVVNGIEWRKRR
jgi:hypothetical protein